MLVNDVRVVTAYGDGIHRAVHEKPSTFTIDTQEMQGDLKVRIEGSCSKHLSKFSSSFPKSILITTSRTEFSNKKYIGKNE